MLFNIKVVGQGHQFLGAYCMHVTAWS